MNKCTKKPGPHTGYCLQGRKITKYKLFKRMHLLGPGEGGSHLKTLLKTHNVARSIGSSGKLAFWEGKKEAESFNFIWIIRCLQPSFIKDAMLEERLLDLFGLSLLWRSLQTSNVSEAFRWKGTEFSRMEGVGGWVEILQAFWSFSGPWRGNPASQKHNSLLPPPLHRHQQEIQSLGISICHLFWLVH